jgi:hypothetical protein
MNADPDDPVKQSNNGARLRSRSPNAITQVFINDRSQLLRCVLWPPGKDHRRRQVQPETAKARRPGNIYGGKNPDKTYPGLNHQEGDVRAVVSRRQ